MKSGMDENAQQMREEITNKMDTNTNKMEANTNEMKNDMKDEMKKMRGEMRHMGRSLQVGMKAITCRTRHEVTQREKLIGVTETCTSETRREVTELTETREMGTIEERLHDTDGRG